MFTNQLTILISLLIYQNQCFAGCEDGLKRNHNGRPILSAEQNSIEQRRRLTLIPDYLPSLEQVRERLGSIPPRETTSRTLVYVESESGFSHVPVLFKTNYAGLVNQLEQLSALGGQQRYSTPFFEFRSMLLAAGYACDFVEAFETDSVLSQSYEIVRGAEGSY